MKLRHKFGHMLGGAAAMWLLGSSTAFAATDVSDVPLFLPGAVPPLNMLVMARDHTLYYEAYNDASDLNGDGTPDVGYKPREIDYFGYFDSHKCYEYWSSGERFVPVSTTADKTCSGYWSGDFLNYLTTSRIDALRKVLYGGSRKTDTDTLTVLERSFIPQDAHSWGKEYESIAKDGYDLRDYAPMDLPNSGTRHLFANTTPLGGSKPLLRILRNRTQRIWDWVSIERPVAGTEVLKSDGSRQTGLNPQDLVVRVEVCKSSMPEDNCRQYPNGNYKPVGLLQEFGEDDEMLFGLISGSYTNNTRGGVLRKNIASISDEIDDDDGTFISDDGIIGTIDKFRTIGFGGSYEYDCGWITDRPIKDGECRMWGSPVGEMIYESLRYFADKGSATSSFVSGVSNGDDADLDLPLEDWEKPFDVHPMCSKPVDLVISGVNASYDTDDIPGSAFSTVTGDLSGFNASSLGDAIWSAEMGGSSEHFIGQSGSVADGAPTAKTVSSFGNIRGLAPEEPTKQGGYYSASATWFGHKEDLSSADGDQKLRSYAVALASPLPRIEIPVNGSLVTLVPFAKSVWGPDGFDISPSKGSFQPTNSIVDFYIEKIGNTGPGNQDSENGGMPYGRFRINFEDVEQGADHDMDAIVFYEFKVTSAGEVEVKLTSEYAAGGIEQHMGYVISGTTDDGIYLEVRDKDTAEWNAHRYFLDTPPGADSGDCAKSSPPSACSDVLELEATRTFKPSGNAAATLLKDPLWYAAKWGGFEDSNDNDIPDVQEEWDADGDGTPDNYFLVTNALNLNEQLSNAFELIVSTASSASSVATNSTRLDTETLIYQARFRSDDWTGELLAYKLLPDGTLGDVQWDAGDLTVMPAPDDRNIFTRDGAVPGSGGGIPFEWDELDSTQQDALDKSAGGTVDGLGEERLAWLRGDQSNELKNTGSFRDRRVPLGDIVNSDPVFVGAQNFGYEVLPATTPGRDTYRTFWQSKVDSDGNAIHPMIYVGANDGMLHGFDAVTGEERLAYVPSTLIPELNQLTDPDYRHRYFVDGYIAVGDAYINRNGTDRWASVLVGTTGAGGKTVFALDVTDPTTFDETDVMWEFTDADLGYPIGQPVVARMADGTWAAVFGNGYGSASEKAILYIVRLSDGTLLKKIDTGTGSGTNPNGLASPTLLADGTRTIRAIYAGDLLGNLWKFDVSQSSTSSWGSAFTGGTTPLPLFVARDKDGFRQPITAPLEISRHPLGGYMLFFGTGKFFETNDNIVGADPQVQSFYGIWDRTSNPATLVTTSRDTALTRQEITYEGPADNTSFEVRLTTANEVDWATKRGWYIDLESPANGPEGERVVAAPILRNGRVVFPTLIPSPDPCGFGGSSWLMEIDAISGARLADSPLDITEDGDIDSDDEVVVDADGDGTDDDAAVVGGVRSREGIIRTPAVIGAGDKEYKIASGTSGSVESLRERGIFDRARGSWRQIR